MKSVLSVDQEFINLYQKIALVKENESPENPGALEERVALNPKGVKALVDKGLQVFVEQGAGERIGYTDDQYVSVGAQLQSFQEIYSDKDLVIKFKGPSMEAIPMMSPGTTLFCMAHFHSYPERAELLKNHQINVIAMEEILESPKIISDEIILSKVAMSEFLQKSGFTMEGVDLHILGYHSRLIGAIRRGGNRATDKFTLWHDVVQMEDLNSLTSQSLFFFDSKTFKGGSELIEDLRSQSYQVFDLAEFEQQKGSGVIAEYRKSHPPFEFGLRRIQCLHETGQAGARYGLRLIREKELKDQPVSDLKVAVMGYGNVGMGAIREIYDHGVKKISILGRRNTAKGRIEDYLSGVDLMVNGAEQPVELRGKNFLISKDHVKNLIPDNSVIIDLVGGSPTNRCAVENVLSCTFLDNPHFVEDGVYFSSLWGWPMMGMMKETADRYSDHIISVLLQQEKLIEGIDKTGPGVQRALVCGPF